MRSSLVLGCVTLGWFALPGVGRSEEHESKPVQKVTHSAGHKETSFDVSTPEKLKEYQDALAKDITAGTFEGAKPYEEVNVLALKWDLGVWAIVVFLLLFFILRSKAWGPILEGLQKREETIRSAVEEAKVARTETQRLQAQYKKEMDEKFAEIPKIMEEARRDAEALKEEFRAQANKEIQAERQRLRREIDSAREQALKEIWEQAARLATLISAKVIGRALNEDDHRRLFDESLLELRAESERR